MNKNGRTEESSVEIVTGGGNLPKFTAEISKFLLMMILIIVVIYSLCARSIFRRMQHNIINKTSCRITLKEICLDMNYRRL